MAEAEKIDRRWIFLMVAVALVLTVRFPFPQPITPSPAVQGVYEFIEDLPPGSAVLIATDWDPQAKAEVVPITRALLHHCFRRGLRVIGVTFWPQGARLGNQLFTEVAEGYGKTSGQDYVYLGFKPGSMAQIITNMGEDFTSAFPQSYAGKQTANMPIFQRVPSLRGLGMIVDVAAGETVSQWLIYGADKYDVPMGAGCTAVVGPDLYVYTNSGQLEGIVAGMRGAADYEALLEKPAKGISGMPAQSTVHAIIVLFVIIGNVVYFTLERKGKQE